MANLSPGALSGLIANAAPIGGGVSTGMAGATSDGFVAMPDTGVQQAAAALPQQLLRQLLASVPHVQVPLATAGEKHM